MSEKRQVPRVMRLLVQTTTTFLLFLSILLTLLILLTPTSSLHLSMFTLKPIGLDRALVQSTSTGDPSTTNNPTPALSAGEVSGYKPYPSSPSVTGLSVDMNHIEPRQVVGSSTNEDISVDEDGKPSNQGYPHHAPIVPGANITGLKAGGQGEKEGLMMFWWLGLHGPTIHVGAMQICSKATAEDKLSCTSASKGAFHAAFLPYTLGEALVNLPKAPPVPVLLLVGGTCALMATIIYIYSLFSTSALGAKCRKAREKANILNRHPNIRQHTRQPSVGSVNSMNSLTTLVNPPTRTAVDQAEDKKSRPGPHLAFFVLATLAFGLGLGATVVEMVIVSRAKTRWDEDEAGRVGMKFELGVLAYLLPWLPIILLLAILTAYIPFIYARFARTSMGLDTADAETASMKSSIETKDISSPKHIETITRVPEQWTRVSLDRPALPPLAHPAPAPVPMKLSSSDVSTVPARPPISVRRTWRNTIESVVGLAV